jgi:hypothetical protein
VTREWCSRGDGTNPGWYSVSRRSVVLRVVSKKGLAVRLTTDI